MHVYEDLLEAEKLTVNDAEMAKYLATSKLYSLNEKIGAKKKLFDVRRL